jgi:hypothetical protein
MGIFDKLKEKKKKKGGTNKNTDARDKSHKKQATDKTPRKKGSVLEKKKKGGTSKDNSARNKRHKKQANDPMIGKKGSVLEKRTPEEKAAAKLKRQTKRGKAPGQTKPYAKKGPIAKMDSSAAANQLKDLGNEKYKGPEKKGYAKKGGSHIKKTEARVARDYAANAAYDAEHGYKKEAKFEKKKLMHVVNRIAGSKNR